MRIILASTQRNAWILDPFAGSSTTGIAANLIGRRYLGIEKEQEFVEISKMRRLEIDDLRTFSTYRSKIKDINKLEMPENYTLWANEDALYNDLPF